MNTGLLILFCVLQAADVLHDADGTQARRARVKPRAIVAPPLQWAV